MEAVLLQAGVAGVMLAWFMWRAEGKWDELQTGQNRIEAAINRQTKAQMLVLIANEGTPSSVRQLAEDLSKETQTAEDERKRHAQLREARSWRRRSDQSPSSSSE